MRPALLRHVEKVMNGEISNSDIKYYIICVWLINIVMYVVQIIFFKYNIENAHSATYIDSISKCKEKKGLSGLTDWELKYESIYLSGIPWCNAGLYTGLVFRFYYLKSEE